jgi:type IX secretion system PorP/SprF family membrane protein
MVRSSLLYIVPLRKVIAIAIIACTHLGISPLAFGQDPVFSQYYLAPLQLNPGLAGLTEDPRFTANYRNQFPGFNQAYRTYALSYDQFFPRMKAGIGGWLLADDAGDGILKTIKAAGIFSYRVQVDRDLFIKMGAEVGIVQATLNWDKLRFGDQIDDYLGTISSGGIPFPTSELAPEKNTVIYPDIGLGGVVYGGTLYAGAGVRHLNSPDPEFLKINESLSPGIPLRWTFHAGGSWPVFREIFRNYMDVTFSPSISLVTQGPFSQVNGGIAMDAGMVTFGLQYRISSGQSESVIGALGLRTNSLRISYSYDATISGFGSGSGAHEIGIVYQLDDGDRESRYNDCFQIFR